MEPPQQAPQPRIVFIGDSGVGKTSLIYYAKNGTADCNAISTIACGITRIESECDGNTIKYQYWDTAGQDTFRNIVPMYFKGADAAILVYAVNDKDSFDHLNDWLKLLIESTKPDIPVLVVGNKIDLDNKNVDEEEGRNWAISKGYQLIFASAMTGENVNMIQDYVVHKFCQTVNAIPSQNLVTDNKRKSNCC